MCIGAELKTSIHTVSHVVDDDLSIVSAEDHWHHSDESVSSI